ncbi:MAG: transglutaminaseTgpA domain-containing protein, partial [Chloroflexota bacterium]
MTGLLARYRTRQNAPAETSMELRWLLFCGMAASTIGLGITGGVFMLPFAAVALTILWFGHRYASQNCEAPSKWVKRGVFLAINFAFLYMLIGLAVGLPYPQGQMAMFGMALISWEMMNRGNMYTGWLFVLANLHVTATLSRGLLFFVPLLVSAACFLAFMWVIEKLDAADDGYKPLAKPEPFWTRVQPSIKLIKSPMAKWGASFGGMAFLVGIVAFIAIPRFAGTPIVPPFTLRVPMSGGIQGRIINPAVPLVQIEGTNNGTSEYYHGFDSQLDLSYRGGLSTATMMYVRSPARSYWRSHAYDLYDGRTWTQSAGDAVTILE